MKPVKNNKETHVHSSSTSKKTSLFIAAIGSLAVLTIGAVVLSPSTGILSKFTSNTTITAKNAASNWAGDSDNTYRAKLSARYATQLDAIVLAILGKGSTMTDAQFKTYLTNLSAGISVIGSNAQYKNNPEVQNILGFLTYEINSTVTILDSDGANVINQVVNLINTPTGTSSQTNSTSTNSDCAPGTEDAYYLSQNPDVKAVVEK